MVEDTEKQAKMAECVLSHIPNIFPGFGDETAQEEDLFKIINTSCARRTATE